MDVGFFESKRATEKGRQSISKVEDDLEEGCVSYQEDILRKSTDAKEIQQDVVSELSSVEAKNVEEVESPNAQVETEVTDEEVEDDDDDDDEWDVKSWDEADLKLPGKCGFADEEVDSEAAIVLDYVTEGNEKKNKTEVADVQNGQNLRSPICCIMGHVDAGKTNFVDCISGTQQIGATYLPAENIRERTKELKADAKLNVPGFLVIDIPGHQSFTKLHSRGPGLCDIAVLVVDIMCGLEPHTIESLNLLKKGNTGFLIALNKVDRIYGWKTCSNAPIRMAIKQQSKDVLIEFNSRLTEIITQFKEHGISTELYYKNKEMGETYNIVPTSAISGEGVPDLLLLLVQWAQRTNIKRVTYSEDVKCTVLDVVEGYQTSIDVVLVNGVLREGDEIVVGGLGGPVFTSIRALLTPHPMRELGVKRTYVPYKEIKAAQCIRIAAQGLKHAIAGASLYVVRPNDDIEVIQKSSMEYVDSVMSRIDKSGEGVYVQASTLWSAEALLDFLKTPEVNIPVSRISIGAVQTMDVMGVSASKKEYATILAYDVEITPEASRLAQQFGVKIFTANIIEHLFDQFKAHMDNFKEEQKREAPQAAVFPRVLKIMPNRTFNTKDPIVLSVHVVEGIAKIGTPICVPGREFMEIGSIVYIQDDDHRVLDYAKKGQRVTINILGGYLDERQKMFGRHFEMEDELVSKITSDSVDALMRHYSNDLSVEDRRLLWKLSVVFKALPCCYQVTQLQLNSN